MTFSYRSYEGFARKLAARCADRVDQLFAAPRKIWIEHSTFVLGADAIPAPVPVRYRRTPYR